MYFHPHDCETMTHATSAANLSLWVDDSGVLHLHESQADGDARCVAVLDELHTRALIGMLEAALEVDV